MSNQKLAKNISIMSIAVAISRVLGLVRDQVMAFFFGATFFNDAFQIAVSIPNLLRLLFGEGALSAAFIPLYDKEGIENGKKAQIKFALNMLSILTLFLLLLTIIGIAFAPLIVKLVSGGLPKETSLLTIKLCRITFPYLFFIGLSSTMIAILNSHNKFFMTGLSSGLYNIGIIMSVTIPYFLYKLPQSSLIYWAASGVFVGGFLQTIINLPFLRKVGYNLKLTFSISGKNMKVLWQKFLPGAIGIGVRQINLLADVYVASFLPLGSITCLRYGARLMQLPLGIFGVATGTAVLPEFSNLINLKKWDDLGERIRFAMLSLIYIMIPITFFLGSIGKDFIRLLFQRGSFDETATTLTYQAFLFYITGLIFYSLNKIITPLFFAAGDTKTPVKISSLMVILNIVLNVSLLLVLKHIGIALATSLTALIQFVILFVLIRKKLPYVKIKSMKINIIKITSISLIIFAFNLLVNYILNSSDTFTSIVRFAINGVIFALILVVGAVVTKLEYSEIIINKLRLNKFLRKLK